MGPLKKNETAACFSTFFLNYEVSKRLSFGRLKEVMVDVFDKKLVSGEWLADANEEVHKVFEDVIVKALLEVSDEDMIMLTKMKVKKFVQLASRTPREASKRRRLR